MSRLDAIALALGVLVIAAAAYFASSLAAQSDPNVRWEGRVPAYFAKILPFGVLWTAQVIWHGDPKGILARELELWQTHNAVIAAQPRITQHVPRAVES